MKIIQFGFYEGNKGHSESDSLYVWQIIKQVSMSSEQQLKCWEGYTTEIECYSYCSMQINW